jgi:hypothetical protein
MWVNPMNRKPFFDRAEHRNAAIAGWLIFAIWVPYSLWGLLWTVIGLGVLHSVLTVRVSAEGRYGFITWIGFWSSWPYVLIARSAWREPEQVEVEQLEDASN